ncbi:hypothetical protein WN51_08040 [Melipona quadrifasciata]|uniref:Uncharacterized protein n=1 Tax=Melipona quadrifasciata TaxID=166423 RepID=A0A0N0U2X5_9HYME|nr:hypothetical protein WN51_08040 [Melipona quadrifasciata]
MGDIPAVRINKAPPFTNVGIDYCWPFHIQKKRFAIGGVLKCTSPCFMCLAIRAVYLELTSDLSTEAFIASLKRFITRRGKLRRCQQ